MHIYISTRGPCTDACTGGVSQPGLRLVAIWKSFGDLVVQQVSREEPEPGPGATLLPLILAHCTCRCHSWAHQLLARCLASTS